VPALLLPFLCVCVRKKSSSRANFDGAIVNDRSRESLYHQKATFAYEGRAVLPVSVYELLRRR
jgi:hypothetical protein